MIKTTKVTNEGKAGPVQGNKAWLATSARSHLVDYSGLRVRRRLSVILRGQAGYRPVVLLFAAALILSLLVLPLPGSLVDLLEQVNPVGYDMMDTDAVTIIDSVNLHNNPEAFRSSQEIGELAQPSEGLDTSEDLARRAMIVVGILVVAALLWGTEALPIGGTVILVAVLMLAFGILSPNEIPKAFVNDAVFFILGILAAAVGVSKTGLDRRIGLLLLSRVRSIESFAFAFFPVLAIASAFLSEHALVAILVPVLMGVYKATCTAQGVNQDRTLAIFLLLGLSYAANVGGPGSPAAGARNAIMMGYLQDAGMPIGFGQWISYGMPLVPVLALTVGAYMYFRCKPKLLVQGMNPSAIVKAEVAKLPGFGGKEAAMALILGPLLSHG